MFADEGPVTGLARLDLVLPGRPDLACDSRASTTESPIRINW